MNLARDWYFMQVGPLDPRARKLPLPDELMGRLLEYVVAHEVGPHARLPAQHEGELACTRSTRSATRTWCRRWATRRRSWTTRASTTSRSRRTTSPSEDLIPRIGPYDIWATKWGYSPLNAATGVVQAGAAKKTGAELHAAEAERTMLDTWAREQDTKPWLRFSTGGAFGSDPGDETEAVGDMDPVRATELGIRNLKRNMQWIQSATVKPTEDST